MIHSFVIRIKGHTAVEKLARGDCRSERMIQDNSEIDE